MLIVIEEGNLLYLLTFFSVSFSSILEIDF